MKPQAKPIALLSCLLLAVAGGAAEFRKSYVFEAGHRSLEEFILPAGPPHPRNNSPTAARIELGRRLFFDPRLSGDGTLACASCHNPALGWSDGLPTARGAKGVVLPRATPSVMNSGFRTILMWDGRAASLEEQAMGPIKSEVEMNADASKLFKWISANPGYQELFERAYPAEGISESTLARALAVFQRSLVSNASPFDRWVQGDAGAMSPEQIEGFKLFVGKARCTTCHSGPDFTDDSFHALGLAGSSGSSGSADPGRYAIRPLKLMQGAFKTPGLRDVERTAPYFHDGSAKTLLAVVEHYDQGGVEKTNLSPDIRPLDLSGAEKQALVAFMRSLSSPQREVRIPELPAD